MNITGSFALFQFLWLAVYENRRKAISGSSYYIYRCGSNYSHSIVAGGFDEMS